MAAHSFASARDAFVATLATLAAEHGCDPELFATPRVDVVEDGAAKP